jgi:hypothetical protein
LDGDRFAYVVEVLAVYPGNKVAGTGFNVDERFTWEALSRRLSTQVVDQAAISKPWAANAIC